MKRFVMRLVVVGLGSELMGDDAAGLKVIDALSRRSYSGVDFKKCFSTGFEIMESIEGYDAAIIADTVITGKYKKGEIIRIEPEEIKYSKRIASFHDFDLLMSVELGKRLNLKMPEKIIIYGIEIEESKDFCEGISDEVAGAVESLTKIISDDISRLRMLAGNYGEINGGITNG
ncbi:MAG: hydrogenase maturation protease [Deltaproteobacteria bacterium]|nr:hydrogenase maturation protease [Deltaproteobacteria bacterium]